MKKLLSIDGGGIRGIIPALVLAEIEKLSNRRIARCFDLIGGTSTGGILALGLGVDNGARQPRYAARDMVRLYTDNAREIFQRSLWRGVSSVGGYTDELYPHAGLERILRKYFGDMTVGSAIVDTMVTTYDLQERQPFFVKSWRDDRKHMLAWEAARATSAAPTYFEPARVTVGTKERVLVDGGVFANNPAMCVYAEARRRWPAETEFLLVSLGTGELIRPIPYEEAKGWGKAGWLLPVMSCMFDGVSDTVDYQLTQMLGAGYYRLQTNLRFGLDDMDNATNGNLNNLKIDAAALIRESRPQLTELVKKLA